jgi:hypothetical protein
MYSDPAKYIFPKGDGLAKRTDMHPHMDFRRAKRIMLGKEGCIKADAMFSAGEAVFSWASVALWNPAELKRLAFWLRDTPCYLVLDADWRAPDKPDVMTQAWLCKSFLERHGVRVKVAAPPYGAYLQNATLKGVDDHLAHGGSMNGLEVLEREAPYGVAEFMYEHGIRRKNSVVRAALAVQALARHCDENGEIYKNLNAVGRATGVGSRRLRRAIPDLVEFGIAEVEGDLEAAPRWQDKDGDWHGWDWVDRPVIRLHSKLRAKTTTHLLGDD